MKINRSIKLPLDKFIELALYDKKFGYYMKKNPFGKMGDFITSPNITRLFSEIIAIWVITFWKSIGSPKNFNLLELGAGNGEMMKVIIETLKNFPECFNNCNFMIFEKSKFLTNKQKANINSDKVRWIQSLNKAKNLPTIYLANEFFDAIPIKQFFKKNDKWFERFVEFRNLKDVQFFLRLLLHCNQNYTPSNLNVKTLHMSKHHSKDPFLYLKLRYLTFCYD